eukprot:scaffold70176_cov16-Tisochrysis_lutea.AAC.2
MMLSQGSYRTCRLAEQETQKGEANTPEEGPFLQSKPATGGTAQFSKKGHRLKEMRARIYLQSCGLWLHVHIAHHICALHSLPSCSLSPQQLADQLKIVSWGPGHFFCGESLPTRIFIPASYLTR